MKTTSKFFGIILFLFGMLCFSGCSSSDDDGDSYVEDAWGDPGTSASNFNPSYSDYIGTDQFTDDYNNFLYLMIMGQSYKDWTFYAWYDIEKGPFGIDEAYDEDLDFLFELEGEINDLYDKGKESIERLDQMEILFTETPETSTRGVFGVLQKCAAFFGVLKSTGEEARKTALGVLAQNPDEAETLFNAMNPKFHYGEDNFAKWIQNLNDGKYDNHGNTIYRELYNRSQEKSVDNAIGRGFYEYAIDNKLTPNDRASNALPKVWKAGVDFATSIPSGVIYGKGFKPSNLVDAYDGNKAAQDAVKIGVATFGAKQTAKAVINLGSKDKSGTEAERKAREKELEEATKAYLNDIQNKAADAKSQTNVEVVDNDKSSQATSVVVKNNENGRINVSVGTTKVPIGLDDDSNVTVTGVDDKGDKFTKSVNAKKGETTKVNGSSDEKEKIVDEEPYFEVDNNTLIFSSEPKGAQTVTVKTNLKLRVKKDPKYGWLTVKRNKNIITVSATKNTGDERKASFKIEFSKNGETVYDAITVKVEQKAFQDVVSDDLGFINFRKFRITSAKFGTAYSGINPMSYSYVENGIEKYMVFSNSELSIQKVNSGTYWVKGSRSVPEYYQGNPGPVGGQINSNEPYGLYFDMSFNITACDPTDYVKNNNCRIEDFVISGYAKRTAGVSDCDDYIEFHYEFGHMDVMVGFVPSEGAIFDLVNTSFNEGEEAVWGKFWIDNQWYTSTYLGDGKHEYTHHSQTYEKRETNMYNMSCTLTARWD